MLRCFDVIMYRCAPSGASKCSRSVLFCSPTHQWQRHCWHTPGKYDINNAHPCTLASRVLLQAVTAKATSPQLSHDPTVISLQQYDDCELLWLQYGRQLSLSKQAIFWVLQVSWLPVRVLVELPLHLHCCIAYLASAEHLMAICCYLYIVAGHTTRHPAM